MVVLRPPKEFGEFSFFILLRRSFFVSPDFEARDFF